MTLWLRIRRARSCLATVVVVVALSALAADLRLPMPNPFGGPVLPISFVAVASLAVGIAVARGLTAGDLAAEATAARRVPVWDVLFAFAVALFAVLLCAGMASVRGPDGVLATGRDVLGGVGLTLVGLRLAGPNAGALLPVGFTIAASMFGFGQDNQPRAWAWPMARADDASSWALALALLLLGAVVVLVTADRTTGQQHA